MQNKNRQTSNDIWRFSVGVTGFEPTASWSRTKRATNCATPRKEKPQQLSCCGVVGDERIELPRAESESAALPLCESPSGFVLGVCPQRSYIIACPVGFVNAFFEKTLFFFANFFISSKILRSCAKLLSPARGRYAGRSALRPAGRSYPAAVWQRFGFAWGFTLSADTVCPTRCRP